MNEKNKNKELTKELMIDVVMCACNNKQMHLVQEAVKKVDREAFLIIMESNEVRGEGFKEH